MKGKIQIVVLIFFQLLATYCGAQNNELKFNLVQDPTGKPLGKINAITQDPYGYIWFAGNSEHCIYRYDGIRMTSFRHEAANSNSLDIDNPEIIC